MISAASCGCAPKGDWPLQAAHLRQGGSFILRLSQAEFRHVSSSLKVSNYLGSVAISGLEPDFQAEVMNEGGPVHVALGRNDEPHIEALAFFGDIQSDIPLETTSRGHRMEGRSVHVESPQHIGLDVSYGSIRITRDAENGESSPPTPALGEYAKNVLTRERAIEPGITLEVSAIAGDVRVMGSDNPQIHVEATQWVQLADKTKGARGHRRAPGGMGRT